MYQPVKIEFGDQQDIADRINPSWRRTAQPMPIMLPRGAFLTSLRLTVRENADRSAEACVTLEWYAPPPEPADG